MSGCKRSRVVVVAWCLLVGLVAAGQTAATGRPGQARKDSSSSQQIGTTYDLFYSLGAAPSPLTPSRFLVESARHLKPGAALDIGSGNGRNTLYLARLGWKVTAVDLSRVGLDQTQFKARQLGLQVDTVAEDINRFDFGRRRWDLILLIDFPFPYRALLPKMRRGLRPGGRILVEAVTVKERGIVKKTQAGKVGLPYHFLRPEDLFTAFRGFEVESRRQGWMATHWGGHAWMIRYLARKPESGRAAAAEGKSAPGNSP